MMEKRGVVILTTGSGKTILAVKIIEVIGVSSFIAVPTLVDQWKDNLMNAFKVKIRDGRKKELEAITFLYDSAYLSADTIGNRSMLLIFDEVHHLPAVAYRQIAEMFASLYRLGLTAIYER
jgi:superfamily II DNA or RNA helicase